MLKKHVCLIAVGAVVAVHAVAGDQEASKGFVETAASTCYCVTLISAVTTNMAKRIKLNGARLPSAHFRPASPKALSGWEWMRLVCMRCDWMAVKVAAAGAV